MRISSERRYNTKSADLPWNQIAHQIQKCVKCILIEWNEWKFQCGIRIAIAHISDYVKNSRITKCPSAMSMCNVHFDCHVEIGIVFWKFCSLLLLSLASSLQNRIWFDINKSLHGQLWNIKIHITEWIFECRCCDCLLRAVRCLSMNMKRNKIVWNLLGHSVLLVTCYKKMAGQAVTRIQQISIVRPLLLKSPKKMSRCGDYLWFGFGLLHSAENRLFYFIVDPVNAFSLFHTPFGGTQRTKSIISRVFRMPYIVRCGSREKRTQLWHNRILFSRYTDRCTFHTFFSISLEFWCSLYDIA